MLKLKPTKHKYAYCGPACLQMVLGYFGVHVSQRKLAKIARTSQMLGTSPKKMARTLRVFGLHAIIKHTTTTFDDIRRAVIRKRIPVIVNWYSTFIPPATGHYSIVVDITRSHITLMDPEIGRTRRMTLRDFNQIWFDFETDLAFRKPPLKVDFRLMIIATPRIVKSKS